MAPSRPPPFSFSLSLRALTLSYANLSMTLNHQWQAWLNRMCLFAIETDNEEHLLLCPSRALCVIVDCRCQVAACHTSTWLREGHDLLFSLSFITIHSNIAEWRVWWMLHLTGKRYLPLIKLLCLSLHSLPLSLRLVSSPPVCRFLCTLFPAQSSDYLHWQTGALKKKSESEALEKKQ